MPAQRRLRRVPARDCAPPLADDSVGNERLIYCAISGFGGEGPYRDYPGYDTIGQGMGGLLSLLTERCLVLPRKSGPT